MQGLTAKEVITTNSFFTTLTADLYNGGQKMYKTITRSSVRIVNLVLKQSCSSGRRRLGPLWFGLQKQSCLVWERVSDSGA
jgi:hypothetical protein